MDHIRVHITANRGIDDITYLAALIAGDTRTYSLGASLLRESRQVGVCDQCANHLHTVSLSFRQDAFGLCCMHDTSGSEDRNVPGCFDRSCKVSSVPRRYVHRCLEGKHM